MRCLRGRPVHSNTKSLSYELHSSDRDTGLLIARSSAPTLPRFTDSLPEAPAACQGTAVTDVSWHLCTPTREWSNVLIFSGVNLSYATTPIRAGFLGTPSSTANLPIILRVYNGLEPVPPATCYSLSCIPLKPLCRSYYGLGANASSSIGRSWLFLPRPMGPTYITSGSFTSRIAAFKPSSSFNSPTSFYLAPCIHLLSWFWQLRQPPFTPIQSSKDSGSTALTKALSREFATRRYDFNREKFVLPC